MSGRWALRAESRRPPRRRSAPSCRFKSLDLRPELVEVVGVDDLRVLGVYDRLRRAANSGARRKRVSGRGRDPNPTRGGAQVCVEPCNDRGFTLSSTSFKESVLLCGKWVGKALRTSRDVTETKCFRVDIASRQRRVAALSVVAALVSTLSVSQARMGVARAASPVPRPTSNRGDYGYKVICGGPATSNPCRRVAGVSAVIHYVTSGPDAPPLNDDNKNGIPDYVDEVRQAADTALAFYARNGFKAPTLDSDGSDARPDVYIVHYSSRVEGGFGLTFAPASAEGGTFVIINNDLDRDPKKVEGGLRTTVAHELFHVIQYSYTPDGMPDWVAEGSATAMAANVFPDLDDVASDAYVDQWLHETARPLYDDRFNCDRCYGDALWWNFVFDQKGSLLQTYLGRLYGYQKLGRPLLLGTQPLDEVMQRRGYGSLFDVFTAFSKELYRTGAIPDATYVLRAPLGLKNARTTGVRSVAGLSMHYVPVIVPSAARGVVVVVKTGGGPVPDVTLIVGGPSGREIKPEVKRVGTVRQLFFSTSFRSARERARVILIVTSGRQAGANYLVTDAAF